jgi:hypothetical protein
MVAWVSLSRLSWPVSIFPSEATSTPECFWRPATCRRYFAHMAGSVLWIASAMKAMICAGSRMPRPMGSVPAIPGDDVPLAIGSWETDSGLPAVATWYAIRTAFCVALIDALYPVIAPTQGTWRALAAFGAESSGVSSPNAVTRPPAGTPLVALAYAAASKPWSLAWRSSAASRTAGERARKTVAPEMANSAWPTEYNVAPSWLPARVRCSLLTREDSLAALFVTKTARKSVALEPPVNPVVDTAPATTGLPNSGRMSAL